MIKACCAFWLHNTKDINQHNKYVYNFLDVSVFSFRCPFNPLLWLLALGGLSRSRIVCIVSFQSHQLVSFSSLILLKLSSWCDKMSNHLGLRSEFVGSNPTITEFYLSRIMHLPTGVGEKKVSSLLCLFSGIHGEFQESQMLSLKLNYKCSRAMSILKPKM